MGVAVDAGEGPVESVRIVNRMVAGASLSSANTPATPCLRGTARWGSIGSTCSATSPGTPAHCRRQRPGLASRCALVEACVSRLVIDCNRPVDAPDLIPPVGEETPIPEMRSSTRSSASVASAPGIDPSMPSSTRLIADRTSRGRETWLISVHTFTPVFKGHSRPWQVGIIHDADDRLAAPLIAGLRTDPSIVVGVNQPYSPADRVYYTHERHARPRGLPCAMIEIRNDEVADASSQRQWGERFARLLTTVDLASDREDTVA